MELECARLTIIKDIKKIKAIHIYVFHKYDQRNLIKLKVRRDFKLFEIIHLPSLIHVVLKKGMGFSLRIPIRIKTIDSELTTSLNNVDEWLNDVMTKRGEDGSLQIIILVESEIEEVSY